MGQPCGCCRVGARRELRGGLFGRRGEGDGLSGEALELADQVVLLALRVDAGLVEVGAEVVVADLGVGQRVPDDRQYRVADRDDDRKSTRLNSSHVKTSYAVFCLKKK